MSKPNWGKLLQQNRVKAIGIPWNDKERKAIYELEIPADYVRRGCLTTEEYEKILKEAKAYEKKHGEKPLDFMTLIELRAKADKLKVEYTPQANKPALVEAIKAKKPSKAGVEAEAKKETDKPETK